VGLAAGQCGQPRCSLLQGARARLVGRRGAGCIQPDRHADCYISPEEHFVTCPNQDVVYGFAYADLDKEPIVFQVPDFVDRFWAYALYDARTDEFSEIGKAYGTKPNFYLMVGPNWKGDTPTGITAVVRSSTSVVTMGPRIFMDDTARIRRLSSRC
jgi:hypothetical protein